MIKKQTYQKHRAFDIVRYLRRLKLIYSLLSLEKFVEAEMAGQRHAFPYNSDRTVNIKAYTKKAQHSYLTLLMQLLLLFFNRIAVILGVDNNT